MISRRRACPDTLLHSAETRSAGARACTTGSYPRRYAEWCVVVLSSRLGADFRRPLADPPPASDPYLTPSPLSVDDSLNSDLLRTIAELEKGVEHEQQRAEKERKKGSRDATLLADAEKLNEALSARVEKMGETEGVTARDLIE